MLVPSTVAKTRDNSRLRLALSWTKGSLNIEHGWSNARVFHDSTRPGIVKI